MRPNLIIIGAQKCGTTSLHHYLNLHPRITMSRQKELDFFIEERNWSKGIQWYERHFLGATTPILGESSPDYTNYPLFDGVPARMHSIVPGAKLIYLMRDPLNRIVSHYIHACTAGNERRPLPEALADLSNSRYTRRSQYYRQLERYLTYYSRENILLLSQEQLLHERRQTLNSVFSFLRVDPKFDSPRFGDIHHKSSDKRQMDPVGVLLEGVVRKSRLRLVSPALAKKLERILTRRFARPFPKPVLSESLRTKLVEYLKDDVKALKRFANREFAEWVSLRGDS